MMNQIDIRKHSGSINCKNRCLSSRYCRACPKLSVLDKVFNLLDAISSYLIGIVIGMILFAIVITHNPLIQKIIHTEQDRIELQFVVTCQANDDGKVRCVEGDSK